MLLSVCVYPYDVSCSPLPYSSLITSLVVTSFNICKMLGINSQIWHYRAFLCVYNYIISIYVFFSLFVIHFLWICLGCSNLEYCIKAPVSSPADPGETSDWSFGWCTGWVILEAHAYDQHHRSQPICTSSFREIKAMEELYSRKRRGGKKKKEKKVIFSKS